MCLLRKVSHLVSRGFSCLSFNACDTYFRAILICPMAINVRKWLFVTHLIVLPPFFDFVYRPNRIMLADLLLRTCSMVFHVLYFPNQNHHFYIETILCMLIQIFISFYKHSIRCSSTFLQKKTNPQ